ncbi:DUF5011 domain-containing protein [Microbulbifer harenosus]|uniref:DUF5011 domain-containing protein n=2 Tax=Microbulbifer harenosus TaxID=2576840 RepID=A0ABY2UGS1_9GAMM|nr:DUF5011 domain-containing protein [Microbulbifer harenosus]
MVRYAMYALIVFICTACGGWDPSGPGRNRAPVIELLGEGSVQIQHGSSYSDAGATARDREDGDLTDKIEVAGLPIPTSTAGNYEVQYSVTDSAGASDTAVRQVIVAENNAPTIQLNGEASMEVEQDAAFSDPGATASDEEDGDLTATVQVAGEVNTAIVGSYTLTYSVVDSAGADASITRSVTVIAKPSPYAHIPITVDKPGFTTVTPLPDSRLVYVSSSSGDDTNDGLTPDTPVKSITRGKSLLRNGNPDWLLLKIGDQWQEGLGKWGKSGRSSGEPMVVTAYGSGSIRPLLMTGSEDGLRVSGGGSSPEVVDNLVISGLHFYAETRDPNSETFSEVTLNRGINWYRGVTSLLIEDNYIGYYKEGIQIDDLDNLNISGVTIRRNIIVDSFAASAHAQGIYIARTEGVLIEENIFDHNGWHDSYPGGEATKFNHSIYIQSNNQDVTIKNNIISRSSSHGMQLRPGGLIEGNFLIRNPISILLGLSGSEGIGGHILNNVVLNGNDISPTELRGWGIDFSTQSDATVEGNIVAHVMSEANNRFGIRQSVNASYISNVTYKWESGTEDPGNYFDPERSIEEYDLLVGGEGTFESFVKNIRAQSRINWNPDYSVERLRKFFKDGFGEESP